MGVLTDNARKGMQRLNRRPDLPGWWPIMQTLLLAGLAAALLLDLVRGDGPGVDSEAGPQRTVVAPAELPDGFVPLEDLAAAEAARNENAGVVTPEVETFDKPVRRLSVAGDPMRSLEVPEEAISVGQRAAQALFTGQSSGIPLVAGTVMNEVMDPVAAAEVLGVNAVSVQSNRVVLAVLVSIGEQEPARTVAVTLLLSQGSWLYLPE
jgi:hypothetical protein